MRCPSCNHRNIEGADHCERCQQPLEDASSSRPRSELEERIMHDSLRLLEPHPPVSVLPETPVAEVLQSMVRHRIGCVLVCQDQNLLGIFSERDALLRLNAEADEWSQRPVSEFMTPKVEAIDVEDPIAFAVHKMDLGGFRHVPVMSEGEVTGIISVRDILRYLTDGFLEDL